jgi:protein-tyrosine phosphatase
MAEMIFKDIVRKAGREEDFYIDSAGTSDENVWNHSGIYPKTKEVLRKNSVDFEEHYARQMTRADYDKFDYIVCMEEYNKRGIFRIIGDDPQCKVYRLLDFTSKPDDIDDPWYHRDFDRTFDEISYGCECLLKTLK